MNPASVGSALRDVLPATLQSLEFEVSSEVNNVLRDLPAGSSALVTGSLVEGLGNASSDIDVFVLLPRGAPRRATAIGIRSGSYVDVEFFTADDVRRFIERVERPGRRDLVGADLSPIDRYYRFSIGVRVRVEQEHEGLLDALQKNRSVAAFGRFSALHAWRLFAEAAYLSSTGEWRASSLLLRDAELWAVARTLATRHGEGYPSIKWTIEKAHRSLANDPPARERLLAPYRSALPGLPERDRRTAALQGMRDRAGLDRDVAAMYSSYEAVLGDGVTLVERKGSARAVTRSTVVSLSAPEMQLLRELERNGSWSESALALGSALDLDPDVLRVAVRPRLERLARHQLVTLREAS